MTYADQVAQAAARARREVDAILTEMEATPQGWRTPGGAVRRWAKRLRAAQAAMDAEGFLLAAGVCDHAGGGEGGGPICLRDGSPR